MIELSRIPWKKLKSYDLEELVYWLFVELGAKDITWRIGGSGSGTSDQGRDIELTYIRTDPDGEILKQKWWIDAKGRTKTVSPTDVKEVVLNASGNKNIDVVVIVTNSQFSNPTRDWVKSWQENNPHPKIKLWEKTELERLCSENPNVVMRLFKNALSNEGKLTVIKNRFWNYAIYIDRPLLQELWKVKNRVNIDYREMLALIASEFANGDIEIRSWGCLLEKDDLLNILLDGLTNFLYLIHKLNEGGSSQEPLIKSLSYLIMLSLLKVGYRETVNFLNNIWDIDERNLPEGVIKLILEPILNSLYRDCFDMCIDDCSRVSSDKYSDKQTTSESYTDRFSLKDVLKRDDSLLILESKEAPCNMGFNVKKFDGCPLNYISDDVDEKELLLEITYKVLNKKSKDTWNVN